MVSQRAGYTGAISRIDIENGGQERVYEGLPSTIEYNPNTGEDRILSIGPNGLAIGEDGTAWIASGGGLSVQTAEALGEFGEGLRGVLRLEGLFGEDPSQATWTPAFDSVQYAIENGADGATTLFNTQSNLNDIEIGPDGQLYAVDAARNVMYGLSPDGEEVESVTVLQRPRRCSPRRNTAWSSRRVAIRAPTTASRSSSVPSRARTTCPTRRAGSKR